MDIPPSKIQSDPKLSFLETRELITSSHIGNEQALPTASRFAAQGSAAMPIRRLIVLVPNIDVDEVHIAREIWERAFSSGLAVLLLSLCDSDSEEPLIQRRLINMAALIRHPRIPVEMQIVYSRNWLKTIKPILKDGDVIVCHEEQKIGLKNKPLVSELRAFQAPVWPMSGYLPPNSETRQQWVSTLVFWSVTLAILAGFFYLQVQASYLTDSLIKNIMLGLSVLGELGSLYFWNSISNTI